MVSITTRLLPSIWAASLLTLSFLMPRFAFGEEAAAPQIAEKTSTEQASQEVPSRLTINEDLTISPIKGWEIGEKKAGMSLVMEEPRPDESQLKDGDTVYRRNVTLTVKPQGIPVDAQTSQEFQKRFAGDMQKSGLVSDFKFTEERFINFKGENDGLVLFSTMSMNGHQLMQMHILLSGPTKHYLLTYTDLAARFQSSGGAYEAAWNSMTSLAFTGEAPKRYAGLIQYGSIAGVIVLALAIFAFIRARSRKNYYGNIADELENAPEVSGAASGFVSSMASSIEDAFSRRAGWNVTRAPEDLEITRVSTLANAQVSYFDTRF